MVGRNDGSQASGSRAWRQRKKLKTVGLCPEGATGGAQGFNPGLAMRYNAP